MTIEIENQPARVEIFALREAPDDRRSFVAVVGREDGKVIFHPEKGGFRYRMAEDKFDSLHTLVTNERYAELASVWKPISVTVDDGETYWDGFSNGTLWNGFECPVFTREVAESGMSPDGPFGLQPEYTQYFWNDEVGSFVIVEAQNGDLDNDFDIAPYLDRIIAGETVELDKIDVTITQARQMVISTEQGPLTVFAMDDGWTWNSRDDFDVHVENAGPAR